jgi:hypothetical protein
VFLSAEEHASGQYNSEAFCHLTVKACRDTARPCLNRRYRLSKRVDNSCVYLQDSCCGIYDNRPQVCREFQCKNGWDLSRVISNNEAFPDSKPSPTKGEDFIGRLTEDAVFVPHPILKVHAVFYLKPRREIIFVKEMAGSCGKFNTRENFDYPQLDDDHILRLINLFNHKEPLRQIYRRVCSHAGEILAQPEFYSIVWLLNKHNIVLNSLNFPGLLSGMD